MSLWEPSIPNSQHRFFNVICIQVGARYLDFLIVERKYAEAASLCPKLLHGSASAWERYYNHCFIYIFYTVCIDTLQFTRLFISDWTGLFSQVGFPFCASPSATCIGSIYTNREPKTTWYCLWGLLREHILTSHHFLRTRCIMVICFSHAGCSSRSCYKSIFSWESPLDC